MSTQNHVLLFSECEGNSPHECCCTFLFLDCCWVGCSVPPSKRLGWNAANTGTFTPLCIIAPEGGEVPATVVVVQRRYPTQVWGEVPGLRGKCRSSRAHAAALQAQESRSLQVRSEFGAVGVTGKRCGNSLQPAWGEGGKAGLPLWSGCALPGCRRVTGRGPASALQPTLWHRRSIQVCTLRTVLHQGKGLSSRTCTKSICMFNAPGCTQTCPGGRSMPVQMA